MKKDVDRLKRITSFLQENNINIFLSGDEVYIRYILGSEVDYAYAYILDTGETGVLCSLMEMDRAKKATWADTIYAFTTSKEVAGENIIIADTIYEAIKKLLEKTVNRRATIGMDLTRSFYNDIIKIKRSLKGKYKVIDVHDKISKVRSIKSKFEVNRIKKAIDIIKIGIKHGFNLALKNLTEKEICLESEYMMKKYGADRIHRFLIVASGPNSAYPHNRPTDRVVGWGDVLTLDYVAAYNGYYGDVTRTSFIGKYVKKIMDIYEIVDTALNIGIDNVYAGVTAKEVDNIVRNYIKSKGYGKNFIHSTGHGIGLEVHEYPRISSTSEAVLENNMIITIEPGIYIAGLGGVRLEEDILVRKRKALVLSKNIERTNIIKNLEG